MPWPTNDADAPIFGNLGRVPACVVIVPGSEGADRSCRGWQFCCWRRARPRMPVATDPPPLRILKLTVLYGLQAANLMWRHPRGFRLDELGRDFPSWLRSQHPAANALDDGRPWVAFSAIRFLEQVIGPQSRVFEYGSGGSTLFFSRRARQAVSVEHQSDWYARVAAALQELPDDRASFIPD